MNISLQNRTAVVCGSTQGIGLAAAQQLAGLGASIVLLARNRDSLDQALRTLPAAQNQKHAALTADFSEPQQVSEVVEAWISKGNQAQILVNNTGGPPAGPIAEAAPADFLNAFNQHLLCNHLLTRALIPGMKASQYGRIVNVISTSVKIPLKGLGVSNTIRAAVANWSKTLANELAPFGITVNNILPGATRTQRLQSLLEKKSQKTGRPEMEVEQEMLREIPMGRFGLPEEVASAIGFLASPAAAYITGINIPVDGGRTGCL